MKKIIMSTAWQMEKIQPYGSIHITYFILGLVACILIAYKLRNASEKQNKIVLYTVGIFLIITEIYKQLFYYYVIGNSTYVWWIFPFQLCSIPMYLCLIAPNVKSKKVKLAMYNFLIAFNLMGGFISFLEPSGLIHEYVTLTIHAFLWHMILVFVGIYLAFSKRGATKLKEYKGAIIVYVVLCIMAFIINIIFKSKPDVNMFYVGPYVDSPIIVFKDISKRFGWYVNTPLFMGCEIFASFSFYFIIVKINNIKKSKIENEKKEKIVA